MVFRLPLRTMQPENPQERFMNITLQGFVLENGIRMDWHEIHAIYAECLDCVETISRYLVFEYEYGGTLGSVDNQLCGGIFGKNPRLLRQKCSQDVQFCCAFFLAGTNFSSKNRLAS